MMDLHISNEIMEQQTPQAIHIRLWHLKKTTTIGRVHFQYSITSHDIIKANTPSDSSLVSIYKLTVQQKLSAKSSVKFKLKVFFSYNQIIYNYNELDWFQESGRLSGEIYSRRWAERSEANYLWPIRWVSFMVWFCIDFMDIYCV